MRLAGEVWVSVSVGFLFFCKQKTAYELRISDWSSDVCSSDLIADEQIAAPIVIVGLPRTGTTKLHRLLSRDPRFYWMSFWESQFPVPFDNETLAEPNARLKEGRAMCELMTTAMPKLAAMHPMVADAADEEAMLTEPTVMSSFNAYRSERRSVGN